ncbi:NUD1 [Sanghuangporus vaninii]
MGPEGKAAPAWQTDDLADEWIEDDEDVEGANEPASRQPQQGTRTMHTDAQGSCNFGTSDICSDRACEATEQTMQVGTFVVHSGLPSVHLPQTPALGKKGGIKDIFSPLQLERLFEPPSPPKSPPLSTPTPQQRIASTSHYLMSSRPAKPSKLSQVVGASTGNGKAEVAGQADKQEDRPAGTEIPTIITFGQAKSSPDCRFTFSVPRSTQRFPARVNFGTPVALSSTPNNKSRNQLSQKTPFSTSQPGTEHQLNPNDSRLRLFQFQYDTFTREHLSAIVDSFGVSSPSNASNSRQSAGTMLPISPPKQDEHEDVETFSRLRAAKRLKLTPPSELTPVGTLQPASQLQRLAIRRDYVGEARSFMQKIKRARGLSLVSAADVQDQGSVCSQPLVQPATTRVPSTRSDELLPSESSSTATMNAENALASETSSMAYRKQAEDLMAKIKSDRQVASRRSDTSLISQKSEEDVPRVRERSWAPSPETRPVSPVAKCLENKENMDPDFDHDPPSYAASIALNKDQLNNTLMIGNQPQTLANSNRQGIVVMPVTIPEEISPAIANRIRSPNPAFLAPPAGIGNARFPAQLRSASINEDLNRLVSTGSTVTTATTLTVGSADSCVKHAGPQMVRIAPADLPSIPERVGGMIFDRSLGRWMKERGPSDKTATRSSVRRSSQGSIPGMEGFTESEDPFRDIESLRDGESNHSPEDAADAGLDETNRSQDENDGTEDMHIISSDTDSFDDSEDAQVSTFTFDRPPTGVVQVMTGREDDLGESDEDAAALESEDESEVDDGESSHGEGDDEALYDNMASMSIQEDQPEFEEGISTAFVDAKAEHQRGNTDPARFKNQPNNMLTPRRPHRRVARPPRSALKSASVTPISKGGRSVSFSDGRKEGKIIGLHPVQGRSEVASGAFDVPQAVNLPATSARSKRIMEMLDDLEESLFDDEQQNAGQQYMMAETMPHVPLGIQKDEVQLAVASPRSFARAQTIRRQGQSSPRRVNTSSRANATFLTECSFGVAHDRLVEVITDVQPFEPYWDSLTALDLSSKRLDSVARLKEFLPKLDCLNLNDNLLSWLSGIPGTVRTLSVVSNALTSLTSFGHLRNLENLDISHNDIDSLQQLKCLSHLRELRADGNKITELDGLEDFDGLLKLSVESNQLHGAHLAKFRWSRLELLNLNNNQIETVTGLDAVPALVSLNLDNNFLSTLDQTEDEAEQDRVKSRDLRILHKLRTLRLSGNRLRYLNVARFPNLRTLYVDNNCLADGGPIQRGQGQRRLPRRLCGLHRLCKLENFSARNQNAAGMRDSGLQLQTGEVRDIKRLYLSGNHLPLLFGIDTQACYNLVYLELAACRLTSLPAEFSSLLPNIRALNLNYNFLESDEIARSLAGLKRLRKVTIVGNRMTGTKVLMKMLSVMGQDIEMLDLRMNPCTLGWYLPLLVQDKDNGALLQPSEPLKEKHHVPFTSTLPPTGRLSAEVPESSEDAAKRRSGVVPSLPSSGADGPVGIGYRTARSSGKNNRRCASQWEALDAQFRRGLPDKAYAGRLAYRGLIMRACPQITVLDGVQISEKERRKAEALLRRVLKKTMVAGVPSHALGQ